MTLDSDELFTAASLRRLMISRGVSADADDESLLLEARSGRHKLAATLLSAWQAEGTALGAELREELDAHRSRIARYRQTIAELSSTPSLRVVKGPAISAHYPPEIVRAAGDLDVVCDDPADLWAAARTLLDGDWEVESFTLLPDRKSPSGQGDVMVELRTPEHEHLGVPYAVGLSTVDVTTSLSTAERTLPPAAMSGVLPSLIALAAERFERPFASRDLLDACLLTQELSAEESRSLASALTWTGLWPEWFRLCKAVANAGLGELPLARDARRHVGRDLAGRLKRSLTGWSPLRVPARIAAATVESDRGRFADRVSQWLHERAGVQRVMRSGLPAYGVRFDDRRHPTFELTRRGRHVVALTPVGAFLLVHGACRAEWLELDPSEKEVSS